MTELFRLLRYVRPYWLRLAVSVVMMAGVGAFEAITALLIGPVFDRVLNPHSADEGILLVKSVPLWKHPLDLRLFVPSWMHNTWTVVAVVIVTVTLGKALCEYLASYLVNYIGFAVVTDLRNQLYDKVIHQSMRFFHGQATGRLMSAVINDIEKIQIAVSTVLADFLRQSFTLVGMAVVLLLLDWKLTIIALPLLIAVVLYAATKIGRRVHHSTRRTQDNVAEISQILQETISGIRIVKAFAMEKFEVGRFREAARRLFRVNLRYVRAQALTSPLMELLGALMIVIMLWVGRGRIKADILTPGAFLVFVYALLKMYEPVKRLTGINNAFQQALGASVKVFEYLDVRRDVQDRPNAVPLAAFHEAVVFDSVSFQYEHHRPLLSGISFRAERGQVVAVVGPSGAGKTTLVNLLPRFFDVLSGRVLIDGRDVRDVTLASLRGQIGMVAQETILFNDTVRNNICYGQADTPDERVFEAAGVAMAHEFILALPKGYDTVIGERGARLSGGQRQRLAIARALLKNPPILILDEATSELDSESEMLVQQALGNLMAGRTVFVIAHRLATVRRADKIIVLDGGRIADAGTHAQLLENGGVYRRLYELQFMEEVVQR
jgi:subfamily B ATP-binding cassette protein MsbA